MPDVPEGMLPETFDYVLEFTIAHEGDTPFMYNNWPLKNPTPDVTVGIGRAIPNEELAVSDEIRTAFRRKGSDGKPTTEIPSADDMRTEFRRVVALKRTGPPAAPSNLFSDYRDKSPIIMDRDAMLQLLRKNMLEFWSSNGQSFPELDQIPAQAQVALMSYNYGARLSKAPNMCNAVRDGDYTTAAIESRINGWDGLKNEDHRRLFTNAQKIITDELDLNTLPDVFKNLPLI